MYLKRLELQGFKSFADRTVLEFKPGITAVIGPNGSGKSNISDAIRWVLGEQSMKSLRGAKSEDIIFAGTQSRKSLGFAEVSMVIDNEDGGLPIEYSEVTVTRKLYRTGESGYFINKVPCRLKDVLELFMDTGIGKDGYSIIGQGKVDEILSNKSEDRRHIFEEAAGIVKYRARREESEKKLEQTKINLIRINDILAEIESNLEPLKLQAEKAKKFLDLREELKNENKSIFSIELQNLIKDRLEKQQQTMLFINRRGYAGFVSCRDCGEAIKCPHCDVTLKLHRNRKLVCHYCGHTENMPTLCPKCGSKYLGGFGIGTQQIETAVKKMFPHARVLRMDADTTSKKGGHDEILSAFANREADILVGTQMIVKGHDFPGVTLVGVIAADMSLYSSDYCANERTFQLICQAAGRAGRGELPGIAIVQTYSPDNYSIETAGRQNYEEFYEEEIAYRKLMKYPPVSNMVSILLQGREQKQLIEVTNYLVEIIKNYKDKYFKELFVIGPADPPVGKINDIYRKIIYLKSDSRQGIIQLKNYLEDVINSSQKFKKINIQFDFKA